MFRHRGKSRTLNHNLKLASLLSFVAGIVNVSGFFSVQQLTTNVTGHFAFFADEIVKQNFGYSTIFLFYILAFFTGAFISSVVVETVQQWNSRIVTLIPVTAEIAILSTIAFLQEETILQYANMIACTLLFAMGLQNALVTKISNSVVRTTHLTGLFTDLGIELSQLFFYRKVEQQLKLKSSIKLRLAIISFFFFGCIVGGYTYFMYGMLTLLLAVLCLTGGLFYDNVKFRIVSYRRKRGGFRPED
ncbi:MAG TPA: YoaK family protein [Sphingobacteriaceae bacterium]